MLSFNSSKVYDTLNNNGSKLKYIKNEEVTVQSFAELKDYDIIYYLGHGQLSKNKLTADGKKLYAIGTGERFSREKMVTYNEELKKLGWTAPLWLDR